MEIHVQEERAAGRCAFCHGDLGPYRLTCTTCHAAYHSDCTERCVSLGCTGELRLSKPVISVAPAAARSDEEPHDERLPVIITTVFVVIVMGLGLTGGALAAVGFAGGSFALVVLYGLFRAFQASWRYATAPSPPRMRRSVSVSPAPTPSTDAPPRPPAAVEGLPLPDMFAAHPIEVAPPAPSIDERRHQGEALRDRHPPGLGRTL